MRAHSKSGSLVKKKNYVKEHMCSIVGGLYSYYAPVEPCNVPFYQHAHDTHMTYHAPATETKCQHENAQPMKYKIISYVYIYYIYIYMYYCMFHFMYAIYCFLFFRDRAQKKRVHALNNSNVCIPNAHT